MLLFISKHYFFLAKFLLLFSFLTFFNLFLDQSLYIVGFCVFVNKDYIKNLISSFTLDFLYNKFVNNNKLFCLRYINLKMLYYLIYISYKNLFLYLYII